MILARDEGKPKHGCFHEREVDFAYADVARHHSSLRARVFPAHWSSEGATLSARPGARSRPVSAALIRSLVKVIAIPPTPFPCHPECSEGSRPTSPRQAQPPWPTVAHSARSFGGCHRLRMTPLFPCHPECSEGSRPTSPKQAQPPWLPVAASLRSFGGCHRLRMTPLFPCHPERSEGSCPTSPQAGPATVATRCR